MKKGFVCTVLVTAAISSVLTLTVYDVLATKYENKTISKITSVKRMLETYSLFDLDDEKVSDYASMAMAAAVGDPYTVYYPEEEFRSYRESLVTSYVGIGATVGANMDKDELEIVAAVDDSPAAKAGIRSGDVLVSIDGRKYGAEELYAAATYLKSGEIGSQVSVTLRREGTGEFEVTLQRDNIVKNSVKSKMINGDAGYIRISEFDSQSASGSTYDEFCEELEGLKSAGMKKLIIDLRNNPGGDFNVVCSIADELLPEGTITYTEDKNGKRLTKNSDKKELDMPICVLVNGGSASASEVLTGALKDYKKATVIGTKTYGKGIVQTVYPFSDGSGMSITTAKYFTPNGVCIHGVGIEPDIVVEPEFTKPVTELEMNEDNQLLRALEVLSE